LFIWGSEDPLVPAAFERHVREAVPQAEHVTLRTGHIPQVERPDELHREISRFLAG
jgi:pimeloyl-ACP methyl ester carboxylesterase